MSALAGGFAAAALLPAVAAASGPAASPFAWRGVVEGAYGAPWDHGERSRVLAWMPAHGFNAYVHAPKDDLYQRTLWRDPYPAAEQAEFTQEIRSAAARGIQWIPSLSPALPEIPTAAAPSSPPSAPLCFSCPGDLDAVLAKLEPFRAAGSHTFMISFDDVVKTVVYPQDIARYGVGDEAFGRANGDFLTRLLAALRARTPDARLLTVGADYSGTSDTSYLRGLRATLSGDVGVMWTGDSIPAAPFSPDDARAYGKLIGREPLVWDNWTDDDTSGNATPLGTARIFLGPYRRSANVAGAVGGFFLNPMNEADLNLLPLATAGDWMRDPSSYQPRRSWLAAVAELAGRTRSRLRVRNSLRAWAETSYSTKLDPRDAPTFTSRSGAFAGAYRAGPWWPHTRDLLVSELRVAAAARQALSALSDRAFYTQASPFLDAAAQAAGAGLLGTQLLVAERPALSVHRARGGGYAGVAAAPDPGRASAIRSGYQQAALATRTNPRFVYGWRGGVAFDVPPSTAPPNAMDTWFDTVDGLDHGWLPQSGAAASSVTVTLAGRPVPIDSAGRFRLPRSACGAQLVATDGAGGKTGLVLPPCRR